MIARDIIYTDLPDKKVSDNNMWLIAACMFGGATSPPWIVADCCDPLLFFDPLFLDVLWRTCLALRSLPGDLLKEFLRDLLIDCTLVK